MIHWKKFAVAFFVVFMVALRFAIIPSWLEPHPKQQRFYGD